MIVLLIFLTCSRIACKNVVPLTLTTENFTQVINSSPTIVTFFTYWCPHSRRFLPELKKAALLLEKEDLQFGLVDCSHNKNFCGNQKVDAYPTIRLYQYASLLFHFFIFILLIEILLGYHILEIGRLVHSMHGHAYNCILSCEYTQMKRKPYLPYQISLMFFTQE